MASLSKIKKPGMLGGSPVFHEIVKIRLILT